MKLCPNAQVVDYRRFKRYWYERLFWAPWRKYDDIYEAKFEIVGNLVYCSPETFKKIRLGEMQAPPMITELDNR
jgi:hypothetical protein